ncbi:hypothetical protein K439DRAFT_1187026 [Ramaria rubella]|nr:hypothetical protein K439DRAFT_1187026 [Ramaria rubella]
MKRGPRPGEERRQNCIYNDHTDSLRRIRKLYGYASYYLQKEATQLPRISIHGKTYIKSCNIQVVSRVFWHGHHEEGRRWAAKKRKKTHFELWPRSAIPDEENATNSFVYQPGYPGNFPRAAHSNNHLPLAIVKVTHDCTIQEWSPESVSLSCNLCFCPERWRPARVLCFPRGTDFAL